VRKLSVLLIQCHSGWRPQELGFIKLKDVDLEKWSFKGGMKTDAGTDRIVPIHSKIRPLVDKKYKEAESLESDYLFNYLESTRGRGNISLTYERYKKCFERIKETLKLNAEHRPHDGRKHFVTLAKKYGVDEYAIKYIVGHSISDMTEKVYTKREFNWLKNEMEKIK
jgi:integrase